MGKFKRSKAETEDFDNSFSFYSVRKTIVNKSHSTKIYISRMIKTILKRLPLLISYKNGNNYNILYLISLKITYP